MYVIQRLSCIIGIKVCFILIFFSSNCPSRNGSPVKISLNTSLAPEEDALMRIHANIQEIKAVQGPPARGIQGPAVRVDPGPTTSVTLRNNQRSAWSLDYKYKRHSSYLSSEYSRQVAWDFASIII